jgi:hypothetical protein
MANHPNGELSVQRLFWTSLLLLVGFWMTLWLLGREFLSDSGLGVWTGARTDDTSQWMADPYTFSHVLHGIFFYWLLLPARSRLSLQGRFLVASLIEAGWEILENTPLDYYGDSILNSTVDLIAAVVGFWLAWKCNWKWVLLLVIAIEVVLAILVRDNLTLNVLMLFYPLESVKEWQLAR